jgi:redox-sensitive bicupin YhaK (pirin superfamily)
MGGQGFGTHGHRDMEIISYVLSGALEHKDSMGTGSVLHYGDVQRMSAGTGVRHSEFNRRAASRCTSCRSGSSLTGRHPAQLRGKHFTPESKQGKLALIASNDGRNGSVLIHQDAEIYASIMAEGDRLNMS